MIPINTVVLVGNLARDPDGGTTQSGIAYCRFTVACQRPFKNAQGQYEADFIDCMAWRQTAEFVQRHFIKGNKIGLRGSLQKRSYDAQDGTKRYVTEVVADNVEFVAPRSDGSGQAAQSGNGQVNRNQNGTIPGIMQPSSNQQQRMDLNGQQANDGFLEVDDDELPF